MRGCAMHPMQGRTDSYGWTNFSTFLDRGGKILFYHVPGMGHCAGGANTYDSFDLLSAVVDWVENGDAPSDVTASRTTPEPGSRKLCAYPAHPHYTGGDKASADSYECRLEIGTACVPYGPSRAFPRAVSRWLFIIANRLLSGAVTS